MRHSEHYTISEAQSFSYHDCPNKLVFKISNRTGMSQRPREYVPSWPIPLQALESRNSLGREACITKVQHVNFEYFTSRGCSINRGKEVNWVTTIPNSLSLYLICCLGPC